MLPPQNNNNFNICLSLFDEFKKKKAHQYCLALWQQQKQTCSWLCFTSYCNFLIMCWQESRLWHFNKKEKQIESSAAAIWLEVFWQWAWYPYHWAGSSYLLRYFAHRYQNWLGRKQSGCLRTYGATHGSQWIHSLPWPLSPFHCGRDITTWYTHAAYPWGYIVANQQKQNGWVLATPHSLLSPFLFRNLESHQIPQCQEVL